MFCECIRNIEQRGLALRSRWHSICVILSCAFCCGCTSPGMRQLEQLEAQLDSIPDAVRLALDSIPFASLNDEERALYAILRTQADYKCYAPLTTDTLIRYATDYYHKSRKNYRAAMAWYSLGCVYTELKDDATAVEAYLKAQSLFPDTTVRYYRLCYQNLGQHYLNRDMSDEALAAYKCYQNIAEGYDHIYADIGLAQAYINKNMPEPAREILENLLQYREEIDKTSLENILLELGKIEYVFNKDYDKADEYFNQLIALYDKGYVDAAHWFKGAIAEKQKNISQAIQYYKMVMQGNEGTYLQYNCARSLLYLTLDSIAQPELYSYIKLFEQTSDSINRIERRSEIDEIRIAHDMELQQRELAESQRRLKYRAILIIVCLLAVTIIAFFAIEQHREQYYLRLQKELQRNQAKIYKMNESAEDNGGDPIRSREEILTLYRANLTASIALFSKDAWATKLKNLSKMHSKDVPSFTLMERTELFKVLDENFITFITNLRDEADKYSNSKLSSENIHLFLLLALGCSTGVIRECLAASKDNVVNQRKKRLQDKFPEDILVFL